MITTPTSKHTHILTHSHRHTHTYSRIRIHTHTYTLTHTRIHMCTHIYFFFLFFSIFSLGIVPLHTLLEVKSWTLKKIIYKLWLTGFATQTEFYVRQKKESKVTDWLILKCFLAPCVLFLVI